MTRDSSPPDAPLWSGLGPEPTLAASRNSTSSTPGRGEPGPRESAMSRRRVRHGEQAELVGDLGGEPARRLAAGGRQGFRGLGELGARAAPARPAGPRCARRCRRGRAAGPRRPRAQAEDVVDRVAVLPGQRGQRRAAFGDRGKPMRVGLEPRRVGRHVGGDVGEQVGDLGEPVGELAGLGVVLADPVEQGARRRGGRRARRRRGHRWTATSRAHSAAVRRVSANPSRDSSADSATSSPAGRGHRLDLTEAEPEHVGLAGPLAGAGDDLVELALGRPSAVGSRSAYVASSAARGAPPNRSSASRWARCWSSRCWSDWPWTATSTSVTSASLVDRDRGSAHERPRPPLGATGCGPGRPDRPRPRRRPRRPPGRTRRDAEASTTPSTRALAGPVRTAPESARAPSSSPSAVTTMVLPAPVSPVITVRPGPELQGRGVDHPQLRDPDLLKHQPLRSTSLPPAASSARRRRSAEPRQPSTGRSNLATSRSVNGASVQPGQAHRPLAAAYLDPGARRQVHRPATVAPQHAGAVGAGDDLDGDHRVGGDHHRAGEERVRADRHDHHRLDAGPHHRSARAEVVGGGAGRASTAPPRRSPTGTAAGCRSRRRPRSSAPGPPSRRWPR